MEYSLEQIADLLDGAERHGKWPDRTNGARLGTMTAAGARGPAPSDRYVKLSDRMARDIASALREHATGKSPRIAGEHRR